MHVLHLFSRFPINVDHGDLPTSSVASWQFFGNENLISPRKALTAKGPMTVLLTVLLNSPACSRVAVPLALQRTGVFSLGDPKYCFTGHQLLEDTAHGMPDFVSPRDICFDSRLP